jgi:hypothetical protein
MGEAAHSIREEEEEEREEGGEEGLGDPVTPLAARTAL